LLKIFDRADIDWFAYISPARKEGAAREIEPSAQAFPLANLLYNGMRGRQVKLRIFRRGKMGADLKI